MRIVLCYSGGLDSTVLLYQLKYSLGNEVRCFGVHYGQRHHRELYAAEEICRRSMSSYKVASLDPTFFLGSSQTSPEIAVPEGHYEEESMKQTVVPNRNMVLLALAGAYAISTKSEAVAYAAHTGDHAIYPDCRPEFTAAMEQAFALCDWNPPKLLRPFIDPVPGMSKADIVKLGAKLGVPFKLTWSCYKGQDKHCGKCGTCVERREAFQVAGVEDPTDYE